MQGGQAVHTRHGHSKAENIHEIDAECLAGYTDRVAPFAKTDDIREMGVVFPKNSMEAVWKAWKVRMAASTVPADGRYVEEAGAGRSRDTRAVAPYSKARIAVEAPVKERDLAGAAHSRSAEKEEPAAAAADRIEKVGHSDKPVVGARSLCSRLMAPGSVRGAGHDRSLS